MPTLKEAIEARKQRFAHNPECARIHEKYLHLLFRDLDEQTKQFIYWPIQAEAAKILGIHRGHINRLVSKGKLGSNGKKGRSCRVEPASLLRYQQYRRQKELYRENDSEL